jgi:uncharacterized protein
MFQLLFAGLALGFISSMHCVGMCGPLALALPIDHLSFSNKIAATTLYHAGRIITYILLGILFGTVGKGFYLAGWQQAFSVATGIIMLLIIIFYFGLKKCFRLKWVENFNWTIQKSIGYFLSKRNYSSYFLLGFANGLLPCGMVYIAIGTALVTGDPLHSAIFMAGFGLATVPALLLLTGISKSLNAMVRNRIKRITPFIMALVATLLIVRGINTNISYPAPLKQQQNLPSPVSCH